VCCTNSKYASKTQKIQRARRPRTKKIPQAAVVVELPPWTAEQHEFRQRLRVAVERRLTKQANELEKECALQMCAMGEDQQLHTDETFEPQEDMAIATQQQQLAPAQHESIGWYEEAFPGSDTSDTDCVLDQHVTEAEHCMTQQMTQQMAQQMELFWHSATPPPSTQSPPPPPPPPALPQALPSWQPLQSAMPTTSSASYASTIPSSFLLFQATQGQFADYGVDQVKSCIAVELA